MLTRISRSGPEIDLEATIKIGNERTHTIGRLDNFVRLVRGKE